MRMTVQSVCGWPVR